MTSLDHFLASLPDRCGHGYHRVQGCPSCPTDEWTLFLDALRSSVRNGLIHQSDVRRRLAGRIPSKHVGLAYRRARMSGLIREVSHERSDDSRGRNAGRMEPVYEWAEAS